MFWNDVGNDLFNGHVRLVKPQICFGFLESWRLLFSGFIWYLNSFVYYMNRLLRQDSFLLVEWLNRLWRKGEAESWYNGYDISYIRGFRCAPTCL